MISSLGVAMLWLCPFSGWVAHHAALTMPNGYRVQASVTDWFLFRRESANLVMLRREDGHEYFRLDHANGFVLWPSRAQTEFGHRDGAPPPTDDSACTGAQRRVSGKSSPHPESTAHSRMAGHSVVIYGWRPDDREVTIAFAPTLGCQLMLLREIQYGRLGLPIGISEFRVTSIRRAGREPDLFPPPSK